MARSRPPALLATALVAATALAAAELLVRLTIGMPVAPVPPDAGLPTLHEPDPVLGWRNKEGHVSWPGRGSDAGRPIEFTFLAGGRRATSREPRGGRPALVVLGGSYAQGWALGDEDTFAWRLQERFPDLAVVNLGTAGYGTVQSLLALDGFLATGPGRVALVVYAFIENHELRNVAPAVWLRALSVATAAGPLAVPFATLDTKGQLRRHPPEASLALPLGHRLASIALLQQSMDRWRTAARAGQGRPVTEALIRELRAASADAGATLVVALLEARPATRRHYAAWLASEGIDAVDCTDPRVADPRWQVPGYGHPGAGINADWAACIGRHLAAHRTEVQPP